MRALLACVVGSLSACSQIFGLHDPVLGNGVVDTSQAQVDLTVSCNGGAVSGSFTLHNNSAGTITYTIMSDVTAITAAPATGMLAPDASVSIMVTAMPGASSGQLSITTNDPAVAALVVPVVLSASGGALLSESTMSINFGQVNVGGMKSMPDTITNSGSDLANVTVTQTGGSTTFTATPSLQLGGGAHMDVTVSFHAMAIGTDTADFSISAPNACSTALTLHVTAQSDN